MVAKMQTRRCRHGVAVSNGKIYAAGGYNGVTFLRTVEAYDTQANQWSYVTPLSVARSRVALTATCGRIYAIGESITLEYFDVNDCSCVEADL